MSQEDMLNKVIDKCKELLELYPDSVSLATSLEDYQDLKIRNTQRRISKTSPRSTKKEKATAKTS
jgi:hypothetical protein